MRPRDERIDVYLGSVGTRSVLCPFRLVARVPLSGLVALPGVTLQIAEAGLLEDQAG
jgi:hypothetical protein